MKGIKASGSILPSGEDATYKSGVYFTKTWVPASWVAPNSAQTYIDVWVTTSVYSNPKVWNSYKLGIENVYRGGSYQIYNDPAHPPMFGNSDG